MGTTINLHWDGSKYAAEPFVFPAGIHVTAASVQPSCNSNGEVWMMHRVELNDYGDCVGVRSFPYSVTAGCANPGTGPSQLDFPAACCPEHSHQYAQVLRRV